MSIKNLLVFVLFLGIVLPQSTILAQSSNTTFGHNRLQYKIFDWKYYSSENFEIYFYGQGGTNAKLAAKYLEDEYLTLTDVLGYAPYSKTKIFLYNSTSDLQQSNVGINENNYTTGGQTNFVKSQVEVAYPGAHVDFKEELRYKVSEILVNDMMYGGSLADMFQNAYLLNLPEWFIEGAALYVAEGWSIEMDDYVRDMVNQKKIPKLSKLTGKEAGLAGQSLWNFIAVKYGRSNVANILNLTRIIRNEESSISNTLGLPFKIFLQEWQNFYIEMSDQTEISYKEAEDSLKLFKRNRKGFIYNTVKISPDGKHIAYSKNDNNKYAIYVQNIESGKEDKVFSSGQKLINQEINQDIPLISWKDNNTIGIVGTKRGKYYLWLYEISSKSKLRNDLSRFNQVNSISFNEGGTVAVVSADMTGQSDIFLISLRRNAIKRITNDLYDDKSPRFIPNTTAIIFSSNRLSDTLQSSTPDLKALNNNHNLFAFDIDTSRLVLKRITNTISKDIKPIPIDESTVYYLSDQKGIYNVFKYSIRDSIYTQVTNFNSSIINYDYFPQSEILSFTMMDDAEQFVYTDKSAPLNQNVFTPATYRQEIEKAKYVSELLRKRRSNVEELSVDSVSENIEVDLSEEMMEIPDSLAETSLIDMESVDMEDLEEDSGLIDTDDYEFDTDVVEETKEQTSFLARLRQSQNISRVQGPYPYFPRFSADNFFLTWIIDPLMGFGIQAEMGMNDMLENHKFLGGIVATTANFRSGKAYADYQFLKYLIDFRARFDRNSIFYAGVTDKVTAQQRYILNKFEFGASYPFSVSSRLSLNPYFIQTRYVDLESDLTSPNLEDNTNITAPYGGARLEYVYDNTILKGLNLYQGTRANISLSHYQGINDDQKSFSNLELDIRHYQAIHREITLATRVFFGHFFGNAPKSYLLGGMDNWLFNEFNGGEKEDDPLFAGREVNNSDILFHRFTTNLRGFDYNKFNGTSSFLFNAELRIPLIKYLHKGPIASNFFRNLQIIGFYDFGSAWKGNSPFEETNSINTEVIASPGSPFQASIKNFKNPWLASYGAGVRTVLLGYYLKFDVAWPIEDFIVGSPQYYLTLGYDF